MAISNGSTVVSFDGDLMRTVIQETVEGTLRSLVEYNDSMFNPLYVDDVTLSFYEDEAHMLAHFERIHSYINLDATEMDLMVDELFPVASRVRYLATGMDVFTLLRIYIDDEGLFLALEPDEPVEPIVRAVEETFADENDSR